MKRFKVTIPFIMSAAIHIASGALIIAVIATSTGNGGKDKTQGKGRGKHDGVSNAEVIPKKNTIEINVVETPKSGEIVTKQIPKKRSINAEKECPGKWYGGIGIQSTGNVQDVISVVFEGYPADLAGLKAGDIIVWVDGGLITGIPGTMLHMSINRNGSIIDFSIVRGKVCYGTKD